MSLPIFFIGNPVRKKTGYAFPGIIRASFTTLRGKQLYVVECTVRGCKGMCHIYNEDQLEYVAQLPRIVKQLGMKR